MDTVDWNLREIFHLVIKQRYATVYNEAGNRLPSHTNIVDEIRDWGLLIKDSIQDDTWYWQN